MMYRLIYAIKSSVIGFKYGWKHGIIHYRGPISVTLPKPEICADKSWKIRNVDGKANIAIGDAKTFSSVIVCANCGTNEGYYDWICK